MYLPLIQHTTHFMKILLQNIRTSKYIEAGTSDWTILHDDARVFGHSLEALMFCLNRGIRNMHILIEFPNPRMNFAYPVTDTKDSDLSPNLLRPKGHAPHWHSQTDTIAPHEPPNHSSSRCEER